jgi:hypothetical protein
MPNKAKAGVGGIDKLLGTTSSVGVTAVWSGIICAQSFNCPAEGAKNKKQHNKVA